MKEINYIYQAYKCQKPNLAREDGNKYISQAEEMLIFVKQYFHS